MIHVSNIKWIPYAATLASALGAEYTCTKEHCVNGLGSMPVYHENSSVYSRRAWLDSNTYLVLLVIFKPDKKDLGKFSNIPEKYRGSPAPKAGFGLEGQALKSS